MNAAVARRILRPLSAALTVVALSLPVAARVAARPASTGRAVGPPATAPSTLVAAASDAVDRVWSPAPAQAGMMPVVDVVGERAVSSADALPDGGEAPEAAMVASELAPMAEAGDAHAAGGKPALAAAPLAPTAPAAGGPQLTATQQPAEPVQAVTGFYAAVGQRRLDQALQFWSARMRAAYPPPVFLYDRFAGTRQMAVRRVAVVSLDPVAGRAAVAVDLVEVSTVPAFNRAWQGTWFLVRTPAGWLLDAPSFRV